MAVAPRRVLAERKRGRVRFVQSTRWAVPAKRTRPLFRSQLGVERVPSGNRTPSQHVQKCGGLRGQERSEQPPSAAHRQHPAGTKGRSHSQSATRLWRVPQQKPSAARRMVRPARAQRGPTITKQPNCQRVRSGLLRTPRSASRFYWRPHNPHRLRWLCFARLFRKQNGRRSPAPDARGHPDDVVTMAFLHE
jgi:hypothetical protein